MQPGAAEILGGLESDNLLVQHPAQRLSCSRLAHFGCLQKTLSAGALGVRGQLARRQLLLALQHLLYPGVCLLLLALLVLEVRRVLRSDKPVAWTVGR